MKVAMVTIAHCAGEVVQMVKCLSCKHEDLNLILSPHVQQASVMTHTWNCWCCRGGDRIITGS